MTLTIILLILAAFLYGRTRGIKAQKEKDSQYVIEIHKK